ncbi:MAG: hypothetical protein KC516_02325 [Nanoarchaeota archaeon]|nr:hypothetical protein [Nanoarchaeota archaeon]
MDLEFLSDLIKDNLGGIEAQLRALGSTEKTIDFFMEKHGWVLLCPKCKTYNLCEKDSDEDREFVLKKKGINIIDKYGEDASLFYCNKCNDYAVRHKKPDLTDK